MKDATTAAEAGSEETERLRALADGTPLKTAEARLQESQSRLAGIVGSAMDAIITIDSDQKVVLFNKAAERMFGCPEAEALGSEIDRFIPARFRHAHRYQVREFGNTGTTNRTMGTLGSLSALRENGEEFPIEASISQVEINGGKLYTVILRDVTERANAEAAAADRARQQAAVANLSQHAIEGRDLERLTTDAVALVAQVLGTECCEMLELTAAGDELVLRAGVGWRDGCIGVHRIPVGPHSQAGYTLLTEGPVLAEDLAHESRFSPPPLLVEHGMVSGVTVLIRGKRRPYGVLGAHTKTRRVFSGDDVHFLQAIGDVLAAAIERRDLEEELLAISGREQRRIGQDLHDGLCQHLAGLEYRTAALAADLANNPEAREEVEKIGELLRDGTRQARMLARGLAPVEMEKNGLMAALTELAISSSRLFRTKCNFVCESPVLITDPMLSNHLYRIAQEAVSNAARHGRAAAIVVKLKESEGQSAVLSITNDGVPLPAEPERAGGMGLHIMRYRAELIGATLRIGATSTGTTAVQCTFKVR